MANVVVEVCKIDEVIPHPNADKLEIARIKGWECIVPKGRYSAGSKVVYFPPDTLLPIEWGDKFGVTKYLSINARYPGFGRIRSTSLRGHHSMGLVVDLADESWKVGKDVAEFYKVEKYNPPPPKASSAAGNCASEMALFGKYTDIENLRNYPDAFSEADEVVVTEKIHGSNTRLGLIDGQWVAGSHEKRRKSPIPERGWFGKLLERIGWMKPRKIEDYLDLVSKSTYWSPLADDNLREMMAFLGEKYKQVVVYGELYGPSCQKGFAYDVPAGRGFRVFDILINGEYQDHDFVVKLCEDCMVEMVPVLGRGRFSMDFVRSLACGKTTLGGSHIREGVVVRPVKEARHPKVGRLILKYISDEYLALKEKKADKGEEMEVDDV